MFIVQYMAKVGLRVGGGGFFCCRITDAERTGKPEVKVKASASALAKGHRELMIAARLDPRVYGTHSAKRGATEALVLAGCTDSQLGVVGRWESDAMPRRYVRGSEKVKAILKRHLR